MSCDFFERDFVAGSPPGELELHAAGCAECAQVSREMIRLAAFEGPLAVPAVPPDLWSQWKAVPRQTLTCEGAADAIARRMDGNTATEDAQRLTFHLSRCEACRETAETLGLLPRLRPAVPAHPIRRPEPTGAIDISVVRQRRARRVFDPRLYAAAACLLAGLVTVISNSLGVAEPGSPLGNFQRAIRVKRAEMTEQVQIWETQVSRRIVATREMLTGYGNAARAIVLTAAGRAAEGILADHPKKEKGSRS